MYCIVDDIVRAIVMYIYFFFFFSSRRRHTRFDCDWSSDVCSSDLNCFHERKSRLASIKLGITNARADFLDALWGSYSERVPRYARCPVIAIPESVSFGHVQWLKTNRNSCALLVRPTSR